MYYKFYIIYYIWRHHIYLYIYIYIYHISDDRPACLNHELAVTSHSNEHGTTVAFWSARKKKVSLTRLSKGFHLRSTSIPRIRAISWWHGRSCVTTRNPTRTGASRPLTISSQLPKMPCFVYKDITFPEMHDRADIFKNRHRNWFIILGFAWCIIGFACFQTL